MPGWRLVAGLPVVGVATERVGAADARGLAELGAGECQLILEVLGALPVHQDAVHALDVPPHLLPAEQAHVRAEARWAVEGISARRKRNQGRVRALQGLRAERAAQIRRQDTAAMALDAEDMCFPSYRQQGILFARGYSMVEMVNQIFSNKKDKLKGRQLPIMYSSTRLNFFTVSGNLTTQYPQAVGWAMAEAYKNADGIASVFTGEGATAEGDFHYALNFASTYRAPVIINVVNNQWAISSFQGIAAGRGETFAARGTGYGLATLRVDGNDVLAVYAATKWAAERARNGGGATVIEHYTYRKEGHSTSDDPSKYRAADEGDVWPFGDPIERLKTHLIHLGEWDDERHETLAETYKKEVRETFKEAEAMGSVANSTQLPDNTMFEQVYETELTHLREQRAMFNEELN